MKKVMSVVSVLIAGGIGTGIILLIKKLNKRIIQEHEVADKHLCILRLLSQWLWIKQRGINLAEYFEENGYKKIAIYGMSYMGECLVNELKDSSVQTVYGIDRNAMNLYLDIPVKTPDESLDPVDAIVVTATSFFDEIEAQLKEKIDSPIISIEDILNDI